MTREHNEVLTRFVRRDGAVLELRLGGYLWQVESCNRHAPRRLCRMRTWAEARAEAGKLGYTEASHLVCAGRVPNCAGEQGPKAGGKYAAEAKVWWDARERKTAQITADVAGRLGE